jgi:aquaporin NIP
VTIIILSTGHISGAHLNPSLTITFAAPRHFPWLQVPAYVSVQVLGSICASYALKGVFHPFLSGGVTVPDVTISTAQAFFTEFIISFNLLFVVTAVATDTRAVSPQRSMHAHHANDRFCCDFALFSQVGELAGIAVGAAVTLNILVAG